MSEPAFPYFHSESCGGVTSTEVATGLTKRELFAAMAMQGLSSNPAMCSMSEGPASAIAQWAVQHADALLAELAKDGAE